MKKSASVRILTFLLMISLIVGIFSACAAKPYPYELDQYISVPDNWSEIAVAESEISVKVKEMIQVARENAAIPENVISRPAADGDLIEAELVCYNSEDYGKGGTSIDFLSDSKCVLIIGEGKYPQELENSIIGRYAGDSFALRLTLPSNYTVSGLAGVTVVYEVSVKTVTALRLPLYNDAFVQAVSGCESVSEYEETLYERAKEEIVWNAIFRASEAKLYPEQELDRHRVDYVTYYTDLATEAEMTLEQYIGKKFFISLTDFHREAELYAKDTVKKELLMYYLEREYDLELSDSEYNRDAKRYATEYGLNSVSALEEKFGREYVRKTVQYDKVMAFLSESVTVTEDIV